MIRGAIMSHVYILVSDTVKFHSHAFWLGGIGVIVGSRGLEDGPLLKTFRSRKLDHSSSAELSVEVIHIETQVSLSITLANGNGAGNTLTWSQNES